MTVPLNEKRIDWVWLACLAAMTVGYFGLVWRPEKLVWELFLGAGIYGYFAARFTTRRLRRTDRPGDFSETAQPAGDAGSDWMQGAAVLLVGIGLGTGLLLSNYAGIAGTFLLHAKTASTAAFVMGLTVLAITSVGRGEARRRVQRSSDRGQNAPETNQT